MRSFISNSLLCLATAFLSITFINCSNSTSTGPGAPATELQGTWKGHTLADTTTFTIIFTGNSFSYSLGSSTAMAAFYSGTFTIDTVSNPKKMDALITQCSLKPQYVGKTSLCIYKISHDTLTYAGNEPGNPQRPASFQMDTATVVFIFKKQ
jgi:uncharacterized protein (TIGR03067 family)